MTNEEIWTRCNKLGVCKDIYESDDCLGIAHNGLTGETIDYSRPKDVIAILTARLAEKVRGKYPRAFVWPSGAGGPWFVAITGNESPSATDLTELGAWLALAEKLFPQEQPTQPDPPKMRTWAAVRAADWGKAEYGVATGENVAFSDGLFSNYHKREWLSFPLPGIHDGMKPGEIREIVATNPAPPVDADFERECNIVRVAVFIHNILHGNPYDAAEIAAALAAGEYRSRFGGGK